MMDRILTNKWSIRIIALLLATILFVSVNNDNTREPAFKSSSDTEVIENVPVDVYYDKHNLYVSGIPKKVTVTVTGPRSIIQNAKAQRDFAVYADLRNATIGEQRVDLKIKGLSNRLKVTLTPGTIRANVQEKVTKDFSVDADFGRSTIAEGYQASKPTIKPRNVSITGAKDTIEKVAYVKATLADNKKHKSNFTGEAPVAVFDKNLNRLDVEVSPEKVTISVTVKKIGKAVPLTLKQTGAPPEDLSIVSMEPEKSEVTVIGDDDILNKIDSIIVPIDVSKITTDTVEEVTIPVPKGAKEIQPSTIEVRIRTAKQTNNPHSKQKKKDDLSNKSPNNEEANHSSDKGDGGQTALNPPDETNDSTTKEFSNVNILTKGLDEDLSAQIISPASGKINITLTGPKLEVEKVKQSELRAVANLSNASVGDYSTKIELRNVPEKITYKLSAEMALFSISKSGANFS